VSINNLTDTVEVQSVNWKDTNTYPKQLADVLIGSDLVYDSNILVLLVQAVQGMLSKEGSFVYIAPDTGRDGMANLVQALATVGMVCQEQYPLPPE
jgi:predicted nicotinamide N-methyase